MDYDIMSVSVETTRNSPEKHSKSKMKTESEEFPLKNDTLVQELVDSYGGWFRKADYENRAGGTGRMTKDLYPYDKLFSPIQINRMTVKNRVVMAPMGC